jgi:two-component system OmpR family sensor kinase
MDGSPNRLTHSLRFQLLAWLSAMVVLTAMLAGAVSFWSSFDEAHDLQDDQLRQIAALFDLRDLPVALPRARNPADAPLEPDLEIAVQILGEGPSNPDPGAPAPLLLPSDLPEGLQTVTVGGTSWRVMVRELPHGQRLAVSQQTEARDEIARNGALRTVLPLLVLVPVIVLLVSLVLKIRLQPVARLAHDVDRRAEHDLSPLPALDAPTEVAPFTAAINRLLNRVAASVEAQRRFVADAAHELRSPLAAVSLQSERLANMVMPPPAQAQLAEMRRGVQRARAVTDQLLRLARFQQATPASDFIPALPVLRHVIEDLMPLAESRGVDLGVVQQDEVAVRLREEELHAVMRNVLDNALRYCPVHSRVDIRLRREPEAACFEVADGGPGIPQHERARVFEAFYRIVGTDVDGSGLGLSIVKTLAERYGGTVTLLDVRPGEELPGLRIVITLPRAPEPFERGDALETLPSDRTMNTRGLAPGAMDPCSDSAGAPRGRSAGPHMLG